MTEAVLPGEPVTSAARTSALRVERPWLAIRNPAAGRARASRRWLAFERALQRAGVEFDLATTRSPGDALDIAAEAAASGAQRFLVAGGDGTVHEVLNGLLRARASPTMPRPILVPVPLGTGNDWARSLGLPRDPDRLARIVRHGTPTAHDVGVIRFPGRHVPTRWFVNVAGTGFDAHVISRLPQLTPSKLAYLGGALRELARYRAPHLRIVPERGAPVEGRFLLAFVANGRYCGHRMHVAPTARTDDGELDLVTIEDVGLLGALPKLLKLYRGDILRDPLVRHARTTTLRIDSDPEAHVEADGQLVGTTPAEFSIEPGALRVLRGP